MSSALTGPLPSAAVCSICPSTSICTVASASDSTIVAALFGDDPKPDQAKELHLLRVLGIVHQQLERGLCAFELEALRLEIFQLHQDLLGFGVFRVEVDPPLFGLVQDIGAPQRSVTETRRRLPTAGGSTCS